jgi:hypothetical protein
MKLYAHIFAVILLLAGIYGICWPLPAFFISPSRAEAYFAAIWNLPANDKSAGAALPFLWFFFTAPIGLLLIVVSFITYVFTRNE